MKIINKILFTNSFNITLYGSQFNNLINGQYGDLLVHLNGNDQYIELPYQNNFIGLWDIEEFELGFTVNFELKILTVKEGWCSCILDHFLVVVGLLFKQNNLVV